MPLMPVRVSLLRTGVRRYNPVTPVRIVWLRQTIFKREDNEFAENANCNASYVYVLKRNGIGTSITRSGDPLENAIADRAI